MKEYAARLIIFPKRGGVVKKGDATAAETAGATQLFGDIVPAPKKGDAVTFGPVTEEMKAFNAFSTLRNARNTAKLVGIRIKQANAKKDDDKKQQE